MYKSHFINEKVGYMANHADDFFSLWFIITNSVAKISTICKSCVLD